MNRGMVDEVSYIDYWDCRRTVGMMDEVSYI